MSSEFRNAERLTVRLGLQWNRFDDGSFIMLNIFYIW